jgi:hypothetical protein
MLNRAAQSSRVVAATVPELPVMFAMVQIRDAGLISGTAATDTGHYPLRDIRSAAKPTKHNYM